MWYSSQETSSPPIARSAAQAVCGLHGLPLNCESASWACTLPGSIARVPESVFLARRMPFRTSLATSCLPTPRSLAACEVV